MDTRESDCLMTQDRPGQFTAGDVNRIIRRALKIEQAETISHEELMETARELGIDAARIEEAIRLEKEAMEKERIRDSYKKRLRSRFTAGLWGFAVLNGFLFLIDLMTPGGWWFQWPLLGTAIPLLMRARYAFFPTEDQIDQAMRRRERRAGRSSRRRHLKGRHKFHCC